MNQSKEPGISFVQQKRMDDMKGRVKVDTHSRIFGWLDDTNCKDANTNDRKESNTKQNCKDANTNDRKESDPKQLPVVECGLAMEKAPEKGDSSKASILDTIKTVHEERAAAGTSISTPEDGKDGCVQSAMKDEAGLATKGIKRNADRNASHS